MEKLDKVIRALELHRSCGSQDSPCLECPYKEYEMYCMSVLERDCLEVLRYQNIRIKELKDSRLAVVALNRPLEEKLQQVEAERDDLRKDIAVLTELLEKADSSLKVLRAWREMSEPVVHAHWVDRPDGAYRICSNCNCGVPTMQRPLVWLRCPVCGAHMDEEVAE